MSQSERLVLATRYRLKRAMSGPRAGRRPPTPRLRMMAAIALAGATVASCGIGATALIIGMSREGSGAPATEPATTAAQAPSGGGGGDAAPPGAGSAPLVVRARTDHCKIFVAVPGPSTDVLTDETLARGAARQYDQPRLNAVIHDASACDVWVNGQRKPLGRPGERQTYTLTKDTPGS